jgi:DNA repair exonuclease SbcCD ATPase subunit
MTLEELGSKLSELDEMRRHAERELSALQDHQERVEQLEEDRDALIKEMAETAPDRLDRLTREERNKVYRMLRLEVTPTPEGYSITGALRVRMQNGTDALEEIPGIGPETLEKIAPFATV